MSIFPFKRTPASTARSIVADTGSINIAYAPRILRSGVINIAKDLVNVFLSKASSIYSVSYTHLTLPTN